MGTEIAPWRASHFSRVPDKSCFGDLGGFPVVRPNVWLPGCWHHTVNGSNPCVRTLSRAVKSGDGKELESH